MNSMGNRERFRAVMAFEQFDRLPVIELDVWWDKTLERWYNEGLPKSLKTREEIERHFGLDIISKLMIYGKSPRCPLPPQYGVGIVKNSQDYDHLLDLDVLFIAPDMATAEQLGRIQQQNDTIVLGGFDGFFWFPRALLGIENHLYAFYDQPKLMHRMNNDLSEYILKTWEKICSIFIPDAIVIAEDLSYNHGPMISKDMFDEFLRPYYEKILPLFKKYDIPVFLDSDGDITELAGWYINIGIEGMLPLERRSGLDVARVRQQHPHIRFAGGFDKTTMHRGESAMRKEFERLLPIATQGGFAISCDHQTPPEVSYTDYQLYLKLFREYAEKAATNMQKRQAT